ncbi:MAG: hypothetical protein WCS51_04810 [Bacilli bacterium]|jgi:hypothetical protein
MEFNIKNTSVYGMDFAVKASGNPMRTEFDRTPLTVKDYLRADKLGGCPQGAAHDNFLKGIIVQFDVTAPLYWWKEAQRYHWLDFISSQSTMHCLIKFDISGQCVKDTNKEVLKVVNKIKDEYNAIPEDKVVEKKIKWRELVASTPCGFCLGASMTTNYQQLKTIYNQRKNHKLQEWHDFCDWCETLPKFLEMTGCHKDVIESK